MKNKSVVGLFLALIIIGGLVLLKARPLFFSKQKQISENEVSIERKVASSSDAAIATTDQHVENTISKTETENSKPQLTTELKMKILDDVFDHRNDNDPRLDTELKNLSDEDKQALEKKYSSQNKEKLNERGTIVFLLGRSIQTAKDLIFIKEVSRDKPCQSFTYCDGPAQKDTEDHDGANDVTLAYPQVMALKSLENLLSKSNIDFNMKQQALEIIHESATSKNLIVKRIAQNILENSENPQ